MVVETNDCIIELMSAYSQGDYNSTILFAEQVREYADIYLMPVINLIIAHSYYKIGDIKSYINYINDTIYYSSIIENLQILYIALLFRGIITNNINDIKESLIYLSNESNIMENI